MDHREYWVNVYATDDGQRIYGNAWKSRGAARMHGTLSNRAGPLYRIRVRLKP